jgi:hypothetical protein
VQKMATKRKQIQNLEITGKTINNSFAILNNIDDDVLLKTTKALRLVWLRMRKVVGSKLHQLKQKKG